ncbi:lysophospholipid acyltransferase family protein [Haliscomenobacter hydrossis]|uniref:Phospholipid/glycerol acyltransferase n=1 Tax=Haliscomenobacter hydrossis (strain ATCC 27775 / DSM 1100 / LMG 10767 / O) TaxID=760192 RepID=F4KSG1_HALH1|nr:lysophospholipid acyltransferase family protein [Haliscomenobacter hydrossis]AEE54312.1 phospholipid/glycerol acyltransferase [Haliscomenobacter hydrossis DSM 1100]
MENNTTIAGEGRWAEFTYADANDPWWKKLLIAGVEHATGRGKIERMYNQIRDLNVHPTALWSLALQQLKVEMDLDRCQLEKVPKEGPIVFISNHPFGLVDGLMLAAIVAEVRKEFVFLVNEVLTRDERLKSYLLPIDFRDTKEALRTNIDSRDRAIERLKQGEALAIFPSGAVATARSWFGPAEEMEWKNFVIKLIQQSRATVIPMYIEGQNSRLFQMVSQVSMPLRLGMLLFEALNKMKRTIRVNVGDPIFIEDLEQSCKRPEMLGFLRSKVEALKP